MKLKVKKANVPDNRKGPEEQKSIEGYPLYPETDDIYIKFRKGKELDPENISRKKGLIKSNKTGDGNEKKINKDLSGSDLDIPGSELDDEQEIIGSEDEENNYYSLGGDNHNDLEEDQGEL